MDAQLAAAIIGGVATIGAALIGALVVRRRAEREPKPAPGTLPAAITEEAAGALEFVDVSVEPDSDWTDAPRPELSGLERAGQPLRSPTARWAIHKLGYDKGADLPLRVMLRNVGTAPVLVSRVGVELVAGMNAWYTGMYYGDAPDARVIDTLGAYELNLGHDPAVRAEVQRVMDVDPDESRWLDLNARCHLALPKPILVEAQAPLVYVLNLKQFDKGMPTHSVLRLWIVADGHETRSDEIGVIFGR